MKKLYRDDLPPLPARLRGRPIERGYPVPWFVANVDGRYDFRVIGRGKIKQAVTEKLCWICGQTMIGHYLTFPIGPMCAINRISSEPPSHWECAEWSARACPFLTQQEVKYNAANLPAGINAAAGCGVQRQPGVILLWETTRYDKLKITEEMVKRGAEPGFLFVIGNPLRTAWMREGRPATRIECLTSIESGYPILLEAAFNDGPEAIQQLEDGKRAAFKLLPADELEAPCTCGQIVYFGEDALERLAWHIKHGHTIGTIPCSNCTLPTKIEPPYGDLCYRCIRADNE
jgi:hypothetical protein